MKTIVLVFLAFFISTTVEGQNEKKWDFQLNLGTSKIVPFKKYSENNLEYNGTIFDTKKINYSSVFGCFTEFIVSYSLNSKFSFLTGINYSNTSFKINSKLGFQNNIGIITTSNVCFPLFVKFKLIEKSPFSISFGPYFRILTNANEEGSIYLDTTNLNIADPNDPLFQPKIDYTNDIKNNYEKYDYGLLLQLDYELLLTKKCKAVILARFNYGLQNVIKNQATNISIPEKWRNYYFDIGIGIKI